MFAATTDAISAVIATTTSVSSSVKPLLPAADILCLAGASRRLVASQRIDVDFAMLTWNLIEIRIAPRVLKRALLLEVRTVPVRRRRRRIDERRQTFLLRRIAA